MHYLSHLLSKKFQRLTITLLLLFLTTFALAQQKNQIRIKSPDGQTVADFTIDATKHLRYRLNFQQRPITEWSALGLLTDQGNFSENIKVHAIRRAKHSEKFAWPLGENDTISNNYNQLEVSCSASGIPFRIIARLYNGSLAFRYAINLKGKTIHLNQELTEFNLTSPYDLYQYHEESVFLPTALAQFNGISDLPTTLASKEHSYLSIGEADNRNYSKCVLIKGEKANGLKLSFYIDTLYRNHQVASIQKDTLLTFRDSLVTPWRTISCAKQATGLHQFSELNLKLVDPLTRKLPTGVKPGKVFRVPISTQGAIDGADFAAKMHFQYIMLDAGWYGAEFRTVSDPTRPIPEVDMPAIISHAHQKGIGVILYVNYVGLKAKLDTILPLFKSWGVSGMKFGFVDGGTQRGLSWLDSAMVKVNKYGFVLNVHDHYKPTGLNRRYPFYLSQEGIRGDENSPDAFHTMVLPYTRYIAGAADFTFCYPSATNSFSKNLKVSKGQQLALTVIYFDPLQAIFWYGKSTEYNPDDTDLEFFKYVPTVWNETRYLKGEIGVYTSVARRKGDDWFIGNATGFSDLNTSIKLDFVNKKKFYEATIYEDDGKGGIRKSVRLVKFGDVLPVKIAAKGGQAIILRPRK